MDPVVRIELKGPPPPALASRVVDGETWLDDDDNSCVRRHWCVTSWYEGKPSWDEKTMKYLVYQPEICPSSGRYHWQTYVECKGTHRPSGVRTLLYPTGGTAWTPSKGSAAPWCKERKGSPLEASAYCKKDDTRMPGTTFAEHGTLSLGQGKRTDINTGVALAMKGNIRGIDPVSLMTHGRGFERVMRVHFRPPLVRPVPDVRVYYGIPGSGKTFTAIVDLHDIKHGVSLVKGLGRPAWFDAYHEGDEAVVVDDFDPNSVDVDITLAMLDRYAWKAPIKGGFVWWTPAVIILTTTILKDRWYCGAHGSKREEVFRRIKTWRPFKDKYESKRN